MPLRLALVCCANGLGHIKRLIKISSSCARRFSLRSVTLFCEDYQQKAIEPWSEFRILSERVRTKIIRVTLPLRWQLDRQYYAEWLLDWHQVMAGWGLRDFDHVISDNLVEPLLHAERATLIGSFLWHEVLYEAFPENGAIQNYRAHCRDLLFSRRPEMIANRYFAAPSIDEQTRAHKIGLIPFCRINDGRQSQRTSIRVLVALGGAQAGEGAMAQLSAAVSLLQGAGIEVLAPSPLCGTLSARFGGVMRFSFLNDDLDSVDAAIIRGGLGTVSDCIAARVPMFYLDDPNPEIAFNQGRLAELGVGLPLGKLLDIGPQLLDMQALSEMTARMAKLDLRGEIEATEVLSRVMAGAPTPLAN